MTLSLKSIIEYYRIRKANAYFEMGYTLEVKRILSSSKEPVCTDSVPTEYVYAFECGIRKARSNFITLVERLVPACRLGAKPEVVDMYDRGWNACRSIMLEIIKGIVSD